jgi:hypothetical protein
MAEDMAESGAGQGDIRAVLALGTDLIPFIVANVGVLSATRT